jgi:hypothetical protein
MGRERGKIKGNDIETKGEKKDEKCEYGGVCAYSQ